MTMTISLPCYYSISFTLFPFPLPAPIRLSLPKNKTGSLITITNSQVEVRVKYIKLESQLSSDSYDDLKIKVGKTRRPSNKVRFFSPIYFHFLVLKLKKKSCEM